MEGEVKSWVTVKVLVDANSQEFISITPTIPAAVWGEREIRDMYGLRPVGLPDERRLVLPDDWPENLHPLRKDAMDYRQRPQPTTETETYQLINLIINWVMTATVSCLWVRYILHRMNRATSVCSLMVKTLLMPITVCSMFTVVWKN